MNNICAVNYKDCVGCWACYNSCHQNAITMKTGMDGFCYPIVTKEACLNCGLCLNTCPIMNESKRKSKEIVYAVSLKDKERKKMSSSGGAFYWMASYFVDIGGAVYGAAFDEVAQKVRHMRVTSQDELSRLQNSKYIQSEIGETYKKVKSDLDAEKVVLFSGTPCQVSGLYSYIRKEYPNLYTCDILCYGVPSPMVFPKYARDIIGDKPIKKINMRDKTIGWIEYSMKIETDDSSYVKSKYEDLYQLGFQTHLFYRESCYECKYRNKYRVGDITLGDFWKFKESFKKDSIHNDNSGISFFMINSNRGEELFSKLDKSVIDLEKRMIDENIDNFGFCKEMTISDEREVFFRRLSELPYKEAIAPYISIKPQKRITLIRRLYRFSKKSYFIRHILFKLHVKI